MIALGRSFLLALTVSASLGLSAADAHARPKTPIAKAYCECRCVRALEGQPGETIYENLGKKVFDAPGGDPAVCAGQNGTTCRSGGVEGKLQGCSGVVERKQVIPDFSIAPDANIAPAP